VVAFKVKQHYFFGFDWIGWDPIQAGQNDSQKEKNAEILFEGLYCRCCFMKPGCPFQGA
jgi:hypothetical protein